MIEQKKNIQKCSEKLACLNLEVSQFVHYAILQTTDYFALQQYSE